jgi:hypothetical protein
MIARAVNDLATDPMMNGVSGHGPPGVVRLAKTTDVGDPIAFDDP